MLTCALIPGSASNSKFCLSALQTNTKNSKAALAKAFNVGSVTLSFFVMFFLIKTLVDNHS